jgi:hypothetical protein
MQNVFIISTGRSASSAMYQHLNKLYNLQLPKNKEPHYYLNLHSFKNKPKILSQLYIGNKKNYRRLYKKSKISVDASVGYFFNIDSFLERTKKISKNSKVIFLYREPIERAKSLFLKQYITGYENSTNFKKSFSRKKLKKNHHWWQFYYNNVKYHENFLKLKKNFKEILVINFDSYPFFLSKIDEIMKDFLKLNILDEEKFDLKKINTSTLESVINYSNFKKFFKKKNKINKIFFLFSFFMKNLRVYFLRKKIHKKNLKKYFLDSLLQYKKLNFYLKKYKIYKGIYIVK